MFKTKKMICFGLSYRFEMGSWNNKMLSIATQYLQYLGTDKLSTEEISKLFFNLACSFGVRAGDEQIDHLDHWIAGEF
jgi:hypothetical protein